MGLSALSAYRGDLVLAQAAAARERPDDHERLVADPPGGGRAANPGRLVPGLPAGRAQQHRGAGRARGDAPAIETLVLTVDTPVAANRENNVRAGFSTPLRPSLRLAWEGLTHPRWLFGTFLRTLVQHGMPHFENNYAERGAPILSPQRRCATSRDRGHLDLEAPRADPRALAGQARGQGHPRRARTRADRARRRRRRHHRLEPRRPPARRRRVAAARAAGSRRRPARTSR